MARYSQDGVLEPTARDDRDIPVETQEGKQPQWFFRSLAIMPNSADQAFSLDALVCALNRVGKALEAIQSAQERIADQLAPEPSEIVGTPFVSKRLGCTTVWIADLVRTGGIPKGCIVAGTGNGKPWKFYRRKIETWLETR